MLLGHLLLNTPPRRIVDPHPPVGMPVRGVEVPQLVRKAAKSHPSEQMVEAANLGQATVPKARVLLVRVDPNPAAPNPAAPSQADPNLVGRDLVDLSRVGLGQVAQPRRGAKSPAMVPAGLLSSKYLLDTKSLS